jgi:hypothetical protein
MTLEEALYRGLLWLYVDDYMGISLARDADNDQIIFRRTAEGVLQVGAINLSKAVPPTVRADLLGWDTRLNEEFIGPNQKGCDKLLHCFCRIDVTHGQTQALWEVLASVAERYSAGLVVMRSFVSPLHHMVQKCGVNATRYTTQKATSAARFCIELWRAVALLLFVDREAMSIPLRQMSHRRPPSSPFSLIADAGPNGVGAGVLGPNGELLVYTAVILPFAPDLNDKFHNLREFTGLLVNLVLFVKWVRSSASPVHGDSLVGTETLVKWNSDSTTAISWMEKEKCNSRCGQHASFALTWFQLIAGITVTECSHISGDTMILSGIDAASRGYPTPMLDARLFLDLSDCDALFDVLRLCVSVE